MNQVNNSGLRKTFSLKGVCSFLFFAVLTTPAFSQTPGGVAGTAATNLRMWLKADAGTSSTTNGAQLSSWNDQSASARHAVQATAALQPTYHTTRLLNFNPSVNFDGTENLSFSTTSLNIGSNARTTFAVGTANNVPGNNQWIFSYGTQTNGQNYSIGQQGGTNNPFNGMWSPTYDIIQTTGTKFSAVPIVIQGGFTPGGGGSIYINSNQRANSVANATPSTVITGSGFIGRSAGGGITEFWDGLISEVIHFNGTLNANETKQVSTYLAVKYGITLESAIGNYRSSGGTDIWNYTTNAGYNNDIAGIGRDDNSGLNQKQSTSSNTDDFLTVGLGGTIAATNAANTNTFANNNSWFLWGNNDGAINAWTATNSPSTCYKRIARQWRITESGETGNLLFRVPESGAASNLPTGINGSVYLLIDNNTDFTTGATIVEMTKVGNNWEVSRNIGTGSYITFATSTVSAVISGTATICAGASTNLSIALTGPTPWSLTYTDGLTDYSVTGINTTPYTPSVKPFAASTTYTLAAISSTGCTTPSTLPVSGSAAITLRAYTSQVPTTHLLSWYKSNNAMTDETGYNPGASTATPTATTNRFGIASTAYSYNGTTQYFYGTDNMASLNNFSYNLWFKTATTTGGKLIGFGSNATGSSGQYDRHVYMANSGQLIFGMYTGGAQIITSPNAYNDNTWHMVTASFNATTGMKLYVDGALVVSNPAIVTCDTYNGYFKIGYDNIGGGWPSNPTSNFFNGSIDEVLIYNTELTTTQISTLYNNPDGAGSNSPVCNNGTLSLTSPTLASATYGWTGPNTFTSATQNANVTTMSAAKVGTYILTVTVSGCNTTSYALGDIDSDLGPLSLVVTSNVQSYYKMENNAQDTYSNSPGILQGSPTATTDRYGNTSNGYALNGTSQFITTARPYTNPGNTTISMWFKTNSSTGGKIIGFGSNQTGLSGTYDRHIYMNNAGQIYFGVNPGAIRTINTPLSYNDNVWHHVVATSSLTTGIKLYIDGVLIVSDAVPVGGQNFTGYWRIGYDQINGAWPAQPTSLYFAGSVDDVLIYNTELSSGNVTTLYNSPHGASSTAPCIGTSMQLEATNVAGTTYAWTGPNTFSAATRNATVNPFVAASLGTYIVTATTTATGCRSTAYTIANLNTTTPGLWTGYTSTNWATTTNWCGGALPTSTTDVTIPAVSNLPTNSSATSAARNVTINALATLTNAATGTLNIYGNLTNNGTFTNSGIYTSTGSIVMSGSTAQTISGSNIVFNNLTINNAAGVTLSTTATVNGILTLTAGTFATGNNLSQNLYNGAISPSGGGATTGNIRFFKTIWGDRYHYLSSPIPGRTVADWNDNIVLKTGANANMYYYNEASPNSDKQVGWTAIGATSYPLADMRGYAVFFPRWIYNTTVDVSGPYTHTATFTSGAMNNTVSNTPAVDPTADGWQLMGNPYPSTIDWSAATGWTKTGITAAIYMWDGRLNRYASFVGTTGNNGGSRYIGAMQGFFVKVTNPGVGTGTLAMNNNVRVTSTLIDVWRTQAAPEKLLRLSATTGEYTDETVIRFASDATEQFDDNSDAYKFPSSGTTPSLSSYSAADEYSINSLPSTLEHKVIPLKLTANAAGDYTFNADLNAFENGESVYLEDRLTETRVDLVDQPTYTLALDKGLYQDRFFIHYTKREATVTENNNPVSNGSIEIAAVQQTIFVLFPTQNSGKADLAVYDILGKKIFSQADATITNGRIDINLPEAQNGIYIVKVQTQEAAKTQQLYLQK